MSTRRIVLPAIFAVAIFTLLSAAPAQAQIVACICQIGCNVISGSAFADVLTGTAGCDCINGGGGDDVIDGAGGNDFICGGARYTGLYWSPGIGLRRIVARDGKLFYSRRSDSESELASLGGDRFHMLGVPAWYMTAWVGILPKIRPLRPQPTGPTPSTTARVRPRAASSTESRPPPAPASRTRAPAGGSAWRARNVKGGGAPRSSGRSAE